ncbi:GNAT family N-acetyltransferase [Salinibacterium sp. SWN248]|uniref:GNAT family N-acetyltransferase n=1 Tax=Salinibacterium sp. SWN248 TaxID=2792056 RepID=UPI0018CDC6DD|nr:GNAT family N-acetyltransferase [Salinibacterium sp. SWN248]MBH0023041.1 GNAT family N-acetyltransferase [Salinibacterium sp. SWN248]
MPIRLLNASDRPLLREATLANMNWCGSRFSFDDLDQSAELAHYYSDFPGENDFGMLDEAGGVARAVAWLVFFSAEHPGYGFIEAATPELSITTFEGFRGQGVGSALLEQLIAEAAARSVPGISLSVEDGNQARSLYARLGFQVVGRSGDSDTMLLRLPRLPRTASTKSQP